MDLQKELESFPPRKTEEEIQEDLLIEEAKKIISRATGEDLQTLKKLGFNSFDEGVKKDKERAEFANSIKNLDPKRIFTRGQIKNLCIKYRLRFLPSSYYKGTIDPSLPQHIRQFEASYKKPSHTRKWFSFGVSYDSDGRFWDIDYMICAPTQSFSLQKRPKDPLLFASLGNDRYYLVHKWGNDLSWYRAISCFPMRSGWTYLLTFLLMGLSIILLSVVWAPFFLIGIITLLLPLFFLAEIEENMSVKQWDSPYIE